MVCVYVVTYGLMCYRTSALLGCRARRCTLATLKRLTVRQDMLCYRIARAASGLSHLGRYQRSDMIGGHYQVTCHKGGSGELYRRALYFSCIFLWGRRGQGRAATKTCFHQLPSDFWYGSMNRSGKVFVRVEISGLQLGATAVACRCTFAS